MSERNDFAKKGPVKTVGKGDINRTKIEQEMGITLRRQNYITADLVLANGPEKDFDAKIGEKAVNAAELKDNKVQNTLSVQKAMENIGRN